MQVKKFIGGFTFIELVIVIGIIGIIAAIGIPAYKDHQNAAKRALVVSTANNLRTLIETTIARCTLNDEVIMPNGEKIDCTVSNYFHNVTRMNLIFKNQFPGKNPFDPRYDLVNVSGSGCNIRGKINLDYTSWSFPGPTRMAMCYITDVDSQSYYFFLEHWPRY